MDNEKEMSEIEKLDAGLPYVFTDPEVAARKRGAVQWCDVYNKIDCLDFKAQEEMISQEFGSTGVTPSVQQGFNCDNGKNIHVGDHLIINYNVTILDIAPVHIGDWAMIGPGTLITTVGHPISPAGRRKRIGIAEPVVIGDDVWIGGNCTILPGVTIGNNVVVAAGAVVTKDVPDNCVVAGVPARVIREIENDV